MRRNLIYFWPIQLAVGLGAAVTAAVLTGALMVGDSVRGSLEDLTLERLGGVDYALVSATFFGEKLAANLQNDPAFGDHIETTAPVILTTGSAIHGLSNARASKVSIQGVDARFLEVFGLQGTATLAHLDQEKEGPPPLVINESLSRELSASIGDAILVSFSRSAEIHPEFLLGERDAYDLVESIRLEVTDIVADSGVGRFGLDPHQNLPLNAYLPLAVLQQALQKENRVNALLATQSSAADEVTIERRLTRLQEILGNTLQLEDFNLLLREGPGYVSVESREMIIAPTLETAVRAAAANLGAPVQRVLTYLANSLTAGDRTIPYSTVTALDFPNSGFLPSLQDERGQTVSRLEENDLLLNQWAAANLQVGVGDTIELSYYVVGPREQLLTETTRLRLKDIVSFNGLGGDRTLTPLIPGVQEAGDMASWDPPIPVDLRRVRPVDEAYWDERGATPKAFLSYSRGERLWATRFGQLTSIRIGTGPDRNETAARRLGTAILDQLEPASRGFVFRPVKDTGLRASAGATDFGVLFISFSFFLIVSAALLVGLLFRLGVEQRSREVGLLLALGYPLRKVRLRFLAEGSLIAGLGSALGLGGAVLYAWLLIYALENWWSAALGSLFLSLHVNPHSLLLGYVVSLLVVVCSIWLAIRKLARIPLPLLLAGGKIDLVSTGQGRWVRALAMTSLGLAATLLVGGILSGAIAAVGLFFAMGTSLLIAGLSLFSLWLHGSERTPIHPGVAGIMARIAGRNSARNPGRSLLSAALVASACFVIVTVQAFRHESGEELLHKESGAGGFVLAARSDVPLHQDLNDSDGRFELGLPDRGSEILSTTEVFPFRLVPGEDVSCLNLYQPRQPRILGVSPEFVDRGGFQFQQTMEAVEQPWALLQQELGKGIIPAVGDANSVMWILHLGLGQDLSVEDENGETIRLRLVGLLQSSIFQGELLVSEANLVKHFPSRSGYSYFLLDTHSQQPQEVAALLEENLTRYGFDVTPTSEVLAGYLAVENTYLSTFQTLGGLGLLLGTLGLGIVLVRNVLERQGELATLRAFGFRRLTLAWMVMMENAILLVLGLLIGTVSAVAAISPHLWGASGVFPWQSLSLTLLAALLVGLSAGTAAVVVTLRIPLLPALKAE